MIYTEYQQVLLTQLQNNDKRIEEIKKEQEEIQEMFRLTRKTLCLPKDHRQSIEKKVKIYNPSELSSKLLYL